MREARSFGDRGEYFREGPTFVKAYKSGVELEFEKASRIYEISRRTGRFVASRPLQLMADKSQISYEYMDRPVRSLRDIYIAALKGRADEDAAGNVFRQVGAALAALHRELALTSSSDWLSTLEAKCEDEVSLRKLDAVESAEFVMLHGDFGFSNIHVFDNVPLDGAQKLIWLIDASPNFFMTFEADATGPAEVDLANLASCMHGLFPVQKQFHCDWDRGKRMFDAVLAGYGEVAQYEPDRVLLRQLVQLTLEQYLRQRVSNLSLRTLALRMLGRRVASSGFYGD